MDTIPVELAAAKTSSKNPPSWVLRAMRWVLPLIYISVFVFPVYVFFSTRGGFSFFAGADMQLFGELIFPLIGLLAYALVWSQFMIGSNMSPLRKVYGWIDKYHHWQGGFALLFALAHPALLFVGVGAELYFSRGFVSTEMVPFVYFGYLNILLIILTASAGLLRNVKMFRKNWYYVHLLNYGLVFSIWIHSWFIGTDVQATGLKYLWIFFGVTVIGSIAGRLYRMVNTRKRLSKLKISSSASAV